MDMHEQAAVELKAVEKQLGTFSLGPLTLKIPRGAIYGLIGPNGAGKTTTLDLLMGLGQPDRGAIRVLGKDPDRDEVAIKERTAYVSPDLNYRIWGTVGRAIDFVSACYRDWNHERCARLQEEFGLRDAEKIAALSFGARMKLALIMALSRDADLLLLDEPTLGLDAIARRQLFAELLTFMRQEERTIVISSHQLSDLERFADHAAIIHRGRVLTSGRMDELVERYVQVQVRARAGLRALDGVHVVSEDGDRARLIVDTSRTNVQAITAAGAEILDETPLTLEEVFLALVGPSGIAQQEPEGKRSALRS